MVNQSVPEKSDMSIVFAFKITMASSNKTGLTQED